MTSARSSDCRKCSSLLVAYCDHELEPRLRDWIDEHVVACRRCGIELSCVELESLRLREALVPMEPPVGFTTSVMDCVREALAHESAIDPPASVKGRGFTSRVLNQVRKDLGQPVRSPRVYPRVFAAVLAAAVLVTAIMLPFFLSKSVAPKQLPGTWFVVEASGSARLRVGDAVTLPFTEELRSGRIVLENGRRASEVDGEDGAGWRIGLEGDGRFTIASRDRIRLDDGELVAWSEAHTGDELRVDLPDGQSLSLRPGRYEITVEDVEGRAIGLAGLDRIAVRVHEGSADLRSNGIVQLLQSGTLAMLEPLRPLQLYRLPSPDALARVHEHEVRGGPTLQRDRDDDVVVRGVVRAAGQVVAGATVAVHAGERQVEALSRADGSYEARIAVADVRSDELWLSARAPAVRQDLASLPYRSFREAPTAGETLLEDVRLDALGERRGRLLGADGAALVGARIRALRIDGFVGTARLLEGAEATSDQDGAFLLAKLPPEQPGETTAWIIEPKSVTLPPHVEYGVAGSGDASPLLIRVDDGGLVELPVQNPATRVLWVEKRPEGVASSYVCRIERIDLPPAGKSAVPVRLVRGANLRWWEDEGSGTPMAAHEGLPKRTNPGEVAILATSPQPRTGTDGLAPPLPGEDGDSLALAASLLGASFGRDAPRPGSSRARRGTAVAELELRVFSDTDYVVPVESARVYVRVGGGAAWFAGWTDLDGRIVVRDLPRNAAVHALAVAGDQPVVVSGGRYLLAAPRVAHRLAMMAVRSIDARLDARLGSALARLTIVDGPFEGFESNARVAAEGVLRVGDLPPGTLRIEVDGQTIELGPDGEVPSARWQPMNKSQDGR